MKVYFKTLLKQSQNFYIEEDNDITIENLRKKILTKKNIY